MYKYLFVWFLSFWLIGKSDLLAQRAFSGLKQENYVLDDSTRLAFSLQNLLFFKNNEYFTKLWPGYTLLGNSIRAELIVQVVPKLRLNIGTQLILFHGRDEAFVDELIWGVEFKLSENWSVKSGSLNSALSHNMLEAIYDTENIILHPQEKGLQFLYNGNNFSTDIWIDWEQFIIWGDPFQEWFTQGTSSEWQIINKANWQFKIPFQSIITHHGGQIDDSPLGVETLVNSAIGYIFEYKFNASSVFIEQYALSFNDVSPSLKYPFEAGRAFLSQIGLTTDKHFFMLGYWYGDYFMSTKGNHLFNHYNPVNPKYIEGQRSFALLKYEFRNFGLDNFKFTTAFEAYYDIFNSYFEYSYGIYFNLNNLYPVIKKK